MSTPTKKSPGRPKGVPELDRKTITRFDTPRKKRFLKSLEKGRTISESAASVGISRNTVYKAMERDDTFKALVEIAQEKAASALEKELQDRIFEGNKKVVYDENGEVITTTVTKDNALLSKALEANMPEKYGKKPTNETKVQINVGDSAIAKLASMLKIDLQDVEGTVVENGPDEEDLEISFDDYEDYMGED